MAKVISEYTPEQVVADSPKLVEIKHTRTAKDVNGADIEIIDWTETKQVDDAISHCEAHKANLQAQLTECEAEIADMIAIRDAV
jgi:hypothetical protein